MDGLLLSYSPTPPLPLALTSSPRLLLTLPLLCFGSLPLLSLFLEACRPVLAERGHLAMVLLVELGAFCVVVLAVRRPVTASTAVTIL